MRKFVSFYGLGAAITGMSVGTSNMLTWQYDPEIKNSFKDNDLQLGTSVITKTLYYSLLWPKAYYDLFTNPKLIRLKTFSSYIKMNVLKFYIFFKWRTRKKYTKY